ncbi:MAG: CHAT domain-containing protein [Gammaproteobacteria bacterium]
MPDPKKLVLLIPVRADAGDPAAAEKPLPAVLQAASRGAGGGPDPFLANVVVEESYPLAAVGRGEAPDTRRIEDGRKLLALEAADGTTIFLRSDRLQEELARLYPEAVQDGQIDFSQFRDREAASRGSGDWIWQKVSLLRLDRDAIIDAALAKAKQRAIEWLGEKVAEPLEEVELFASSLGARALMWAIESRLAGQPGLYLWHGGELAGSDRCPEDDPRLTEAVQAGPLLIFIHGTASHTLGAFRDLRAPGASTDWEPLARRFGERVFGFEHRTFSESPIDNALFLAHALPAGARLSLVTHSRGGLVGDLLCLGALDDAPIDAYRREAPVGKDESEWQRHVREKVAAEEQRKLRELRGLLNDKRFRIERYLRVACPARGTTLLSDNLEVFLSGLLSLTAKLAGALAGPGGSAVSSAFKRIVLEIADKRVEPQLVPGIEAMLTDAPMGMLLARAPRQQGIEMAVIAGDIEGGGLLKRIAVMFTDWMLFDKADNDLVVDTASMYGGLARPGDTRYRYDRGESVHHLSYFDNRTTRGALRDWLTVDVPRDLAAFSLLEEGREPQPIDARARAATRGEVTQDSRPVVILLPGIMGSHLEVRGDAQQPGDGERVWFDPRNLAWGGLEPIRLDAPKVREEALFETFYGDLGEHLEATHTVIRFPYDWRRPIQDTAGRLAEVVRDALDRNPSHPVRLLAHGTGGLVVRAMIAGHSWIWKHVVARSGGRFVMLGTPNNGSHGMVETLLGKSDSVRNLARLGMRHKMQGVLDIIAGFPGALQSLPRPGFHDSGGPQEQDYFVAALWEGYRANNQDRWFGDGVVGVPPEAILQAAKALWSDEALGTLNTIPDPERVAHVFGQAENTPCGVKIEGGRLRMVGTGEGDGSVSWASGRLDNLPAERCWHMPVAHGNLAGSEEYFPAILELLETGETARLGRLPVSRGVAATRSYGAGPVPYPTEEAIARSLLGARPKRRKTRFIRGRLAVRVLAMDLRLARLPILCGHYIGDPIAGAEAQIDRYVVDGALTQRERLGVYAGEIGTSAVVLSAYREEDVRGGGGRGAVIVGLGTFGELSVSGVAETVRAGVLRYLLHSLDRGAGEAPPRPGAPPREIGLASLLIGYNSTANIGVEDSVAAVVRGVCEANRQFEDAMGPRLCVGRLEFIELFLDNAITAAHAARQLPERMDRDLRRLGATLEAAERLTEGDGVRHRLTVGSPFGYWPRLMVTDADRPDEVCPPECYRIRRVSPIPEEVRRELWEEQHRRAGQQPGHGEAVGPPPDGNPSAAAGQHPSPPVSRITLAERLKYVFLSERARAEAVVHQRQPGLIEALVKNAIHREQFNPDLAQTLFQLMVPVGFKAAARDTERLVLLVDGYTANLPWEMLQADDEPMVLKTAVVRQLVSTRFRSSVRSTTNKTACIIVDPSTEGFREHFGKPGNAPLPRLPGAVQEGTAVREILTSAKYEVELAPSESAALDVIAKLFKHPYRILMIAAHGELELCTRDGSPRSGVVLSDGVSLTAAEVGQMEVVPDLVFLNCCHLGRVDAVPAYNRLAYSLARELIEIGVRCVVAAGWKVNDQAARTFAESFFNAFVGEGRPFGLAVHSARRAAYDGHAGCNTWGAYQAYGDPSFRLEPGRDGTEPVATTPVSPRELLESLGRLRADAQHDKKRDLKWATREVNERLRLAPPEWADLPEVQYALGALYADYGQAGFEPARTAYLRAAAQEDKSGRVSLKAIEQLANLEARAGEKQGGAEGLWLIERAIDRLEGLLSCTRESTSPTEAAAAETPGGAKGRTNAERWSLLGSAWKRKAAVLAGTSSPWRVVKEALEESRNAYQGGFGSASGADLEPYPVLNRLQLDGLLGDFDPDTKNQLIPLAEYAAKRARQRFAGSYDFFDAVMPAHAELAIRMIERTLVTSADTLTKAYHDAVAEVPGNARQFDSVVQELRLLARFYTLRGSRDDLQSAAALLEVADKVDPQSAAGAGWAHPGVDGVDGERRSAESAPAKGTRVSKDARPVGDPKPPASRSTAPRKSRRKPS